MPRVGDKQMNGRYRNGLTDGRLSRYFFSHGVRLSPLGTAATFGLLYQPQMIDDADCGVIGGMLIGRGNRCNRRKPAPVPLCPSQILHDLTRDETRAGKVASRQLTA
jgi:hypothetical protein